MLFNDIIRAAMRETNTTQQQLGEKLGLRQTAISNTIVRPGTSVTKFITVMDALGYDIIVQPRDHEGERRVLTNE